MSLLIIEDDKYIRQKISKALLSFKKVDSCESPNEAKILLKKKTYTVVIVDIGLVESYDGLALIPLIKSSKAKCIVLSSERNQEIIKKSYELGCDHFIGKRDFEKYLPKYVSCIQDEQDIKNFIRKNFITRDEQMIDSLRSLLEVINTDTPIFITGETGVGKTIISKWIHDQSLRSKHQFIDLNCSAINSSIAESELFGVKGGAYTDAKMCRDGLIKNADKGTLFLDEIGSTTLELQKKLLKVIEEKKYHPVGSSKMLKSDFRLISATCDDVDMLIESGNFRKDFYYRISGFHFHIPPLNQRRNDIKYLIKHFINLSPRKAYFKDEVLVLLEQYNWPGNVRELKNTISKLIMSKNGVVSVCQLPENIRHFKKISKSINTIDFDRICEDGLKKYIENIEIEATKMMLQKNNNLLSKTIKDLKISTSVFYRIFNKLKVQTDG